MIHRKEVLRMKNDYERNVYSLPPEPRGVANAVVGY